MRRGPAVTQFGVEPGYVERPGPDGEPKQQKVRVGQIAALQRDLTLALAVTRLRIEAPVPGRSVVGIEVPNAESSIVRMRNIRESPGFARLNSSLGVALGRDVAGAPVMTDAAGEAKLGMSLAELNLSVRAMNCLESENIHTVRDLVQKSQDQLLEVRNFGDTTLKEVTEKLTSMGLRLNMRVPVGGGF